MSKHNKMRLREQVPLRRRDLVELVKRPIIKEIRAAMVEMISRIDEVEESLGMLLRQKARELQAERDSRASQTEGEQ